MLVEKETDRTSTLDEIRKGDRRYLQQLYNQYRKEFGLWATKYYQVDDDVAGEVYQQTFIAFYYNIRDGKLTELRSSIKTYLFAIGKNLMREHFKSTKRVVESANLTVAPEEVDEGIMAQYEDADLKERIRSVLEQIGEPCKTVIELFYFKQYAMDAIATQLNYKTEQIAAKRKFICLKQLKALMKSK